jgi:hypothetical protein
MDGGRERGREGGREEGREGRREGWRMGGHKKTSVCLSLTLFTPACLPACVCARARVFAHVLAAGDGGGVPAAGRQVQRVYEGLAPIRSLSLSSSLSTPPLFSSSLSPLTSVVPLSLSPCRARTTGPFVLISLVRAHQSAGSSESPPRTPLPPRLPSTLTCPRRRRPAALLNPGPGPAPRPATTIFVAARPAPAVGAEAGGCGAAGLPTHSELLRHFTRFGQVARTLPGH